jgi:protein XagA
MYIMHLKIIGLKKYSEYNKNNPMKKLLILVFFAFMSSSIYAGFPIGRGKYLLVPSYNLYMAKGYWDKDGNYFAFNNNGKFTSHYFGVYGGVGLSDKVDFVGNISYMIQRKFETGLTQQNASLGDATLGLQYLLNSFDYYKFLSVTGSLIIPLYNNDAAKQPFTGFQQVGGEVKMGFSGTNRERMANTYYDITAGVRQFFSPEGPTQIFADALFGIPLDDDNKLTFSMNGVKSTSTSVIFDPNNLLLNRAFSFFRLTAGYGRKINQNYQVFVNIFTDVAGRNTGQGRGGSVSLVAKLSK